MEYWFELKALPVCKCGRTLCKKGMIRQLQANKNCRPGPRSGLISSSVATIGMECRSCGRHWDWRFLIVDRYERSSAKPVPSDCWPLGIEESAVAGLMRILRGRETGRVAPPATERITSMDAEAADRARRNIAAIRKQMGWTQGALK